MFQTCEYKLSRGAATIYARTHASTSEKVKKIMTGFMKNGVTGT